MHVAFAKKKVLEAQADELMTSLDTILFQALNIKIPAAPANTVNSRVFTVKQSALSGWRFDPAYFEVRLSVLRQAIRDGKNKLMPLGKVCAFLSNGRTPAADEYSDNPTTFPVIKVASYQNELIDLKKVAYATFQQAFAVQKGDVFVLSAAHQPDYVGRFVKQLDEEPQTPTSFVGELICLRANKSIVDPDYLFALFCSNTFQDLLNCEKRGQTSHIYPSDIKHILIPVPSTIEQVQIAEQVRSIRNKARHLRHQSDLILQQAKQSVEKLILGET
jgi:restriction endonuclease S subunit